ncbi:MAG: hypothetical protein ACTSU3_05210 [Candidatus Thorarchaeota archaeon]
MPEIVDDIDALNSIWRSILPDEVKKWVIFKYGTIVICHEDDKDPSEHGLEVMREYGPVVGGTPLGDFNPGLAGSNPGWVVTYSHPDIGNYVNPDEMGANEASPINIGMTGREKRHEDFLALEIVHVESD